MRQGKHIVMGNGQRILTIPRHSPVNALTLGGIVRDAGLTVEQFREFFSSATTDLPEGGPPTTPRPTTNNPTPHALMDAQGEKRYDFAALSGAKLVWRPSPATTHEQ